jgi:hypothetical protein
MSPIRAADPFFWALVLATDLDVKLSDGQTVRNFRSMR